MRTRKAQLAEASDFHEQDIKATKADILDIRRRIASTDEAFTSFRDTLDRFQTAIRDDYLKLQERLVARLERLEGDGIWSESETEQADEPPAGKKRKTLTVVEPPEPQQASV